MKRRRRGTRGSVLAGALLLLAVAAGSRSSVVSSSDSTIDRPTFPVVAPFGLFAGLPGRRVEDPRLFAFDAATRAWRDAPFQVDERSGGLGAYVTHEDGIVDDNDELVGLARDLGGEPGPCDWPPDAPDADVRYDLRVTDPLDPGAEGWFTVVASSSRAEVPVLVRWDRQASELRGTDYRLVQARGYVGIETLELFGDGVDVLDRTKLRAKVYVKVAPRIGPLPLPTIVYDETFTEESDEVVANADGFVFRPVKEGPVRLVLEPDGSGFAYPGQVQLFAAFGRVNIPPLPENVMPYVERLDLHFHVALDFTDDAVPGRYADVNRPAGVPIDGRHESLPERPIGSWRQIDTPHGGIVLVAGRPQSLRALANYYNDRGRDEQPGTGDNKAYGENGVFTEDYQAVRYVTDFLGWLVVVPPSSPVVGELVERQLQEPLAVEVRRVERGACAPTPTGARATPTFDEPTPTRAAPGTPGGTSSPSATSGTSASPTGAITPDPTDQVTPTDPTPGGTGTSPAGRPVWLPVAWLRPRASYGGAPRVHAADERQVDVGGPGLPGADLPAAPSDRR